jgi:hypothetical protein
VKSEIALDDHPSLVVQMKMREMSDEEMESLSTFSEDRNVTGRLTYYIFLLFTSPLLSFLYTLLFE